MKRQSPFVLGAVVVHLATLIGAAWPAVGADPPLVVELWPGQPPDENGNPLTERIWMSPKLDRKQVEVTESTRLVTDVSKPTLTIHRPAREKDTGTAMLICPGGGYWNLYWQLEGEEVAAWLNSIGVTGIILKYRVPRRPDEIKGEPARRPLQDAQRAVSLVRSKAGEWGLHHIGMVGFSAGGHLAIATATSFEKRTYEPRDSIDRVSCRPDFAVALYSGYLKVKDKDELAPALHVPAGTPPVFLAHGGDDIISPPEHSVLMYLALRRAGVPAELHVYARTAHDFGVRASDLPASTWTQACAHWLQHMGLLRPPPLKLMSFDSEQLPRNKAGDPYVSQYKGNGEATVTLEKEGGIRGGCVKFEVTKGNFYPQFNAHNADGTRGFAREYIEDPGKWQFNTYNRMSFWIQTPPGARPLDRGGRETIQFGTFVKRITGEDTHSDETGGGHWYHLLNLPASGTWTKVVLNMHPHHLRGASGGTEHGNRPHPTGEENYNYFDTLTRFYLEAMGRPAAYPLVYRLDEFQFYCEPHPENDAQVYGIAASYLPAEKRLVLTWSRDKTQNQIPHQVRYAFESIHELGWDKATPAPGGTVKPPGDGGYNGMLYSTTDVSVAGRRAIYFAIRPEGAEQFSQIELPILEK
jgi:acetyl esterase/lipase